MTGEFLTELELIHLGGQKWKVAQPLRYRAKDGRIFEVCAGFRTDGASVPRVLWALYPPVGGDYDEAAVLHDYLFQCAEKLGLSFTQVNALMLEAMEAKGFRKTGRYTIYVGISLGGYFIWRRYRANPPQCEPSK